jgi:hypothetical protein
MAKFHSLTAAFRKLLQATIVFFVLSQCADEELNVTPTISPEQDLATSTLSTSIVSPADCAVCSYVVPSNTYIVDGAALKLGPGSVICLKALNTYKDIVFRNIIGSSTNPIIITNCGGTANLNATGMSFGLKTENSKYFHITGGTGSTYGIKITGGQMGMTLEKLSTNFEIDHVEVYNSGFAGIMAKTDPTCDDATIRGHFTMKDVSFHHNYVHTTGGEGFYIGNSFYEKGESLSCGTRYPHIIDGLKIYNNKVLNTGWDGIQVGCALYGAYVYNNTVLNYGTSNTTYQKSGIQFNEGSKAICHNNYIKTGTGTGINVVGYGDAFLHDNVIVNAGDFGIFADDRTRPVATVRVLNNTIVNSKNDGIRLYTDLVPNIVQNNIIVNPGSYSTYSYPRSGNDAYVYLLNKTMNVSMANNMFTRDINYPKFSNAANYNYRLLSTSPAINKGKDISIYSISQDFYFQSRKKGTAYDIGASEY